MNSRLTVTVLLWALSSACATPRGVWLDTGQGAPREYWSPGASRSVGVGADAFEDALTRWVLGMPLALGPVQRGCASCSSNGADARWQRLMGKSFVGLCKAGQRRADCLSLLDDVAGLGEWDKLGVALSLSLEPLKKSISRAVEDTLAPQLFYALITTGLVSWAVLAANPEPVFTKAAAVMSAVLLLYLGVEVFLELVDASRELKRASDRATTPEELKQAGQRFASRVGPEVARVFVLAVTVAMSQGMTGGAAWMVSRLSTLPRFSEAAALGASQVGVDLVQVWQVGEVAVVGGTVVISLPATALAMVARERGGEGPAAGLLGQQHHVISRPIAEALGQHPTLRGLYTARDPRFVTRAADRASHNGYQRWHRDVDDEVVRWLTEHPTATREQFEKLLREIYSRPEMLQRFPHGF